MCVGYEPFPSMSIVTVTVTGSPLADTPLTTEVLMRNVGLLARELIIRRTISGRDANDATFAPYSAGYAIRKAKEVGPGPVNLQLSGAMLNAITIDTVTATSVTLGFNG